MPPAPYCIELFKHAERIEPYPDANLPENSLAVLYELAWKDQDESALFHKVPVRRDECRMNIEVPEYMTGFWSGGAYCRMMQAIESALWPEREANKSSDTAMDVDSDPQYNPFKTNAMFSKSEIVDGIIVTGGPGIGKTLFMIYVLTLCLLARQPVVWQADSDQILVFDEEGVYSSPLHRELPLYMPEEAFYLVDCNRECPSPKARLMLNLLKLKRGKLLYFASLRYQNMDFITENQVELPLLFMEQCTPEDLVCCRLLWDKPVSEKQIEEFIKLYGCSARNAYSYARRLAVFEGRIDNKTSPLTKQGLFDALAQTSGSMKAPSDDSHDIFRVEPHPTDPQNYTIKIYTRHIYDVVMKRLRSLERGAAVDLFRMFCGITRSRACAGYIIEDWVIGRLPQGGEWRLNTMEVSTRKKKLHWRDVGNGSLRYFRIGYHGTATITDDCVDTPSFDPIRTFSYNSGDDGKSEALPKADGIGIPEKANQPTYDLFVWLAKEKRAIMVQVTVFPRHTVVKKGLKQLKEAGAKYLDLIVVTPVLEEESIDVYTDKADESMLEHVYHLTVTDRDMEQIPEILCNL